MTPFTTLTSIAAPLIRDNVDTDAIIPSREMISTGKTGLKDGLFAPWRYINAETRTPNADFVLNDPHYADAQILLSGKNFGCGSSREHAVWALAESGFRCVIAESFAPIFESNCIRNGVLPITCGQPVDPAFFGQIMTINLAEQHMSVSGRHRPFHIDEEAKQMLLEGLDAIDLTLKHSDAISAWQAKDRAARPWVYLSPLQDGGGGSKLPPPTNASVLRARKLRREMSPPEAALWRELRKRPGGLKFRRQHPAAGYTLDFYCAASKLCVEVDGEHHNRGEQPQKDMKRDHFMKQNGIATIWLKTVDISRNLEGSLAHIVDVAQQRLPLHRSSNGPPPHSANGEET